MSTPIWLPWRTPAMMSPLTTFVIRVSTASYVWTRSENRKHASSGWFRARSAMIRANEMRVAGWICPNRMRRGAARTASNPTARVVCSAPTASCPAPRSTPTPSPAAWNAPSAASMIALVGEGSMTVSGATSAMPSGRSPVPSRHAIQPATVGHVREAAVEPTTSPKCPARTGNSNTFAAGATVAILRTPAGTPISSTSPSTARTGQVMSDSETTWSPTTKPPTIIRFWMITCSIMSTIAGPDQATNPSPPMKRRCRSCPRSASRLWSWRRKSTCERAVLIGSSSRNAVEANHPGSGRSLKT